MPMAAREPCRDDKLIPETVMSLRIRPIFLTLLLSVAAAASHAQSFTTIDYPGAVWTWAAATNDAGSTIGTYTLNTLPINQGGHIYGFVRDASGNFSTIDVPGTMQVLPVGINAAGVIAGWYEDNSYTDHSFVRTPDGQMTYFDDPAAGPGSFAVGINAEGTIVGNAGSNSGYLRGAMGKIRTLKLSGVIGINSLGTILGSVYTYRNGLWYGYVRDRDGTITTFRTPLVGDYNTQPSAISDSGYITGCAQILYACGPFLRDPSGNFSYFSITTKRPTVAWPVSVNSRVTVTGFAQHNDGTRVGFIRRLDGTSFRLVRPDSINTSPSNINNAGVVSGWYEDYSSNYHGFLWIP